MEFKYKIIERITGDPYFISNYLHNKKWARDSIVEIREDIKKIHEIISPLIPPEKEKPKCELCRHFDEERYECRKSAPVVVPREGGEGYETKFPSLIYSNHNQGCGEFEQAKA